jgi:hypothetical protein
MVTLKTPSQIKMKEPYLKKDSTLVAVIVINSVSNS